MRSARDAFGFGALGTLNLAPGLALSGEASYTTAAHDINTGATTGEFNTDEVAIGAALIKSYNQAGWFAEAGVSMSYDMSDADSYTNSAGTFIAGFVTETASLGSSGQVGLSLPGPGELVQAVQPWVGASLDWNFVNEGDIAVAGVPVFDTAEILYPFSGGARLLVAGGGTASVHAGYTGSDSAFESVSVGGELSVPLAGFGALEGTAFAFAADRGGSLNFNVERTDADATMMLRLDVPLT